MVNKNYGIGASFESRFIAKLLKDGHAVKGGRFYASKGVTDVWWISHNGRHNEAQLKFSSIKEPYMPKEELWELRVFANKFEKQITTWLVKKQARKPQTMEKITL